MGDGAGDEEESEMSEDLCVSEKTIPADSLQEGEYMFLKAWESGACGMPESPHVALMGLAMNCIWVRQMAETGSLEKSLTTHGQILQTCLFIASDEEWEPNPKWPFTRQQMLEDFCFKFGEIVPDLMLKTYED